MNYVDLVDWIKNKMRMEDGHNYQPVMIKYLNKNGGKATKKNIQQELKQ